MKASLTTITLPLKLKERFRALSVLTIHQLMEEIEMKGQNLNTEEKNFMTSLKNIPEFEIRYFSLIKAFGGVLYE